VRDQQSINVISQNPSLRERERERERESIILKFFNIKKKEKKKEKGKTIMIRLRCIQQITLQNISKTPGVNQDMEMNIVATLLLVHGMEASSSSFFI
jgi:hypothetical protein